MSEEDRRHWDGRYEDSEVAPFEGELSPPPLFAEIEHLFPTSGMALDVACGRGRGAVWLAQRGLDVFGFDVSPVAIGLAEQHAEDVGVTERCLFVAHDLDAGLPPGGQVDLVLCYLFRDASLDEAMVERLKPGGTLAIACLSEVGHGPGSFRARPGELTDAFGTLDVLEAGEADGSAWLLART